jgi:LysR family hydrogen peroxide-inducible transcriptional activator
MHQLDFAAGSIETLRRMVEIDQGITILPSLALRQMAREKLANVRHFRPPAPVREIGLVTYRHPLKERLVKALQESIIAHLPEDVEPAGREVLVQAVKS